MAAAGIYAFIVGWNEFIFALAFISDSQLMPVTVSLYNFSAGHVIFWHLMMAAATIGILPVVLLFAGVQRQMVHGLTAGATR